MDNKDSVVKLCNAVIDTNKSYVDAVVRQNKINGRFTFLALAGIAYVAVTLCQRKKLNEKIDILEKELKGLKQTEGE